MAVCALTVLDGVGEEATALGGVALLVVAIILAWLSTHVADRGDHILGTILTVGAHASLIGLGGPDTYMGGPTSMDVEDQPDSASASEEKPEDEEIQAEEGEENELLDIQRVRKKKRKIRRENKGSRQHTEGGADEGECDDDDDDDDKEEEEEEVDDESENITVRLKYLNDTEELAVLRPHDTVGLLKSKYFSGRERQIKLIWQGQLLQDPRRTLSSLNITHKSVLHCHVSQVQAPPDAPSGPEESARARAESGMSGSFRSAGLALSSSSLVVPVFVVMLAVVWYFRIHYRQLFTAPATVSLVGVTVFFSFFIFGMHSR